MKVEIQPVTKVLNEMEIVSVNVNLDQSAFITAYVKNETGMGYTSQLFMDQEAYSNWGSNDDYVINWTLEQLGLTRA